MPRYPSRWIRARPRPNACRCARWVSNRPSWRAGFRPARAGRGAPAIVRGVRAWCRARGRWLRLGQRGPAAAQPLQTTESFACTISQVIALRPDRIALYAYAHLPERFRRSAASTRRTCPTAPLRVGLLSAAIEGFLAWLCLHRHGPFRAAFRFAGAGPQRGELHRNFQGHSTQPDRDLVALGVSAIGRIGNTYSQNVKTLDAYYEAIESRAPRPSGAWS